MIRFINVQVTQSRSGAAVNEGPDLLLHCVEYLPLAPPPGLGVLLVTFQSTLAFNLYGFSFPDTGTSNVAQLTSLAVC